MRMRSTGSRPLHGIVLPDVRTGAALDLATFSGVLVAIRHHG